MQGFALGCAQRPQPAGSLVQLAAVARRSFGKAQCMRIVQQPGLGPIDLAGGLFAPQQQPAQHGLLFGWPFSRRADMTLGLGFGVATGAALFQSFAFFSQPVLASQRIQLFVHVLPYRLQIDHVQGGIAAL